MYSAELLEEARRMMFHMLSKVVEYEPYRVCRRLFYLS